MKERLRLSEIFIPPDRLRELDEEKAQLMAVSVAQHGVFHPIAVYRTNAAEKPYTLIFGRHRHRAAQIAGHEEIDATIHKESERKTLEIAENLFRNDLTAIERAGFVEAWFTTNGISQGKRTSLPTLLEVFPGQNVSERAAEQLGFSGRTARRLRQIGRDLHPDLKTALRGTLAENNQVWLLKFAKKGPTEQANFAKCILDVGFEEAWRDLRSSRPPQARDRYKALVSAWRTASEEERTRFLKELPLRQRWQPSET